MRDSVATYARVSTADQAGTGTSLADQERRLRAAVVARGARLVDHFVDAGISGAIDSRAGLDRLRQAARDGQVNVLMATKIDRVSRSAVGLLALIEELRKCNCHLVLIDEGLDTSTAAGDLTSGLLGVIGGWERRRIAERTKAGRRAAAEIEGRFVGSTPPFGFRVAASPGGKGKRLAVDDNQASTVRRMYVLLVVEQRSVAVAAQFLNHDGRLTPSGKRWTIESLGRWSLREDPLRVASGIWVFDGIEVRVPPILSPSEVTNWRAWQDERRQPGRRPRGPYLLSGMVTMPCGRAAMGRTAGRQRPTYSCRQHYLPKGDPARHEQCLNVSCTSMDNAVLDHIQRALSQPDVLRQTARARLGLIGEEANIYSRLVIELRECEESLAAEARLFRAQGYSGPALVAVLAPLHEKRLSLSKELAVARRHLGSQDSDQADVYKVVQMLRDGLADASRETWRELLKALLVRVGVDAFEGCPACTGSGYLPFEPGLGRRRPQNCSLCLKGSVPVLTIEFNDVAASEIANCATEARRAGGREVL
jgi:DNA invertase Pin-like site-specific DNA recombinase